MSAIIDSANAVWSHADNSNFKPSAITVEGWLKIVGDPANYGYVALNGGNWNFYYSTGSGGGDRKAQAFWRNTGATGYTASGSQITDGLWHHYAFTVDGSNIILYIDGSAVATVAASGTTQQSSSTLQVGADAGDSSSVHNVRVSDVRIWNVARTSTQISTNYTKRLVGNETNLVAYYKFTEGSGNTASDSTSNALNLSATAGNWSTDNPPAFSPIGGGIVAFFMK